MPNPSAFQPVFDRPPTLRRIAPDASTSQVNQNQVAANERDLRLRDSANEFESVFIAEMLRHAGFEDALSGKSGLGGEAFSSLLVDKYAEQIVANGGFGLAEKIYQQLRKAPK